MDLIAVDFRAPIFFRELLIAITSVCDSGEHHSIRGLGLDKNAFSFVKGANSQTLLFIAQKLYRANAVQVKLNDHLINRICRAIQNGEDLSLPLDVTPISEPDDVFFHESVIKQVVFMVSDSVTGAADLMSGIDSDVKQFLCRSSVAVLELVVTALMKLRGIQFQFDSQRINPICHEVMRHTQRESIKDLMIIKGAPIIMISMLFSEETEDRQSVRRARLGVTPKRGRPQTHNERELYKFITLWHGRQTMSMVSRFLSIHQETGYNFQKLYELASQAARSAEYGDLLTTFNVAGSSARV